MFPFKKLLLSVPKMNLKLYLVFKYTKYTEYTKYAVILSSISITEIEFLQIYFSTFLKRATLHVFF